VRVTTAFKRLLRLDDVNVTAVEFGTSTITVAVALRRRRLVCPHCGHKTSARYDTRPCPSSWRHLDHGVWQVQVQATLRRLSCPTHGVVVEGVPFARPGAHLTVDFDDLVAWLATRTDKTSGSPSNPGRFTRFPEPARRAAQSSVRSALRKESASR